MANFDNLLKGLGAFTQGIKTFAQSKAINEANEQVRELNQQELNFQEQIQAENQLAQSLALRLTQAGADASTVSAATSRFGVSKGALFQAEINRQLQASRIEAQTKLAEEERASRESLQEAALASAEKRTGLTVGATLTAADKRIASAERIAASKFAAEQLDELKKETNRIKELTPLGFNIVEGERPTPENTKTVTDLAGAFRKVAPRVQEMKEIVQNFGSFELWDSDARTRMKLLAKEVLVIYNSKFAELGALAGGDLEILEIIVNQPSLFTRNSAAMASLLKLGQGTAADIRSTARTNKFELIKNSRIDKLANDVSSGLLQPEVKKELDAFYTQKGTAFEFAGLTRSVIESILKNPKHPDHEALKAKLSAEGFESLGFTQTAVVPTPQQVNPGQPRLPSAFLGF